MELANSPLGIHGWEGPAQRPRVGVSSPAVCSGHRVGGTLSPLCVPKLQACLYAYALVTAHTPLGAQPPPTPEGVCPLESCPRFSGAMISRKLFGILHQNESSPWARILCYPGLLS